MDTQEIKKYLQSVKRLNTLINSKIEVLDGLRQLSKSITSFNENEKVKASKNTDKMSDIIAKIIDLERAINKDVDEFVDRLKEVEELIQTVDNKDYRNLLTLRYLSFKTWEEIASEMDYSLRWIYTLHGRALISINSSQ